MVQAALAGGVEEDSYSRNSSHQAQCFEHVREAIAKAINKQCKVFETSTVSVADFGSSSGPNAGWQAEFVVKEISKLSSAVIQVFFTDLPDNDFNTLFKFLPRLQGQPYFYGAVPGSFYNKLFTNSTLHFAMSNSSLQWLSKIPDSVKCKDSPAWNPGRISMDKFCSLETANAFTQLAREDLSSFLERRAEELVTGGILSITIIGRPSVEHFASFDESFQAAWDDLVHQGVLTQETLDSYNYPSYYPSMAEVDTTLKLCTQFQLLYKKQAEFPRFDPEASDYPDKQTQFIKALSRNSVQEHLGDEKAVELLYQKMKTIVGTRAYPATDFAVLELVLQRV